MEKVLALILVLVVSLMIPAWVPAPIYGSASHRADLPRVLLHDYIPRVPNLTGVSPPLLGAPTGVASYNGNSKLGTTSVRSTTTFESAEIGPSFFPNQTPLTNQTLSLQENAVLWVPGHGVYWTQNVLFIYGPSQFSQQVELIDNVWNFSSPTVDPLLKSDVAGNGTAQEFNKNLGFYYYLDPTVFNVTDPFTVNLTMSVVPSNSASTIEFGYAVKDSNGTVYKGVYDKVSLFPGAKPANAYYRIGGFAPIGLPSDLESVLGGPGGGSYVFINQISATMALYYMGAKGYNPVPDAYSYGSDTAEEAVEATVQRNLSNPGEPEALVTSGGLSAYQLWPVPAVSTIHYTVNYTSSQLLITGYLEYLAGTGSVGTALVGVKVTLSVNGQQVSSTVTGGGGRYAFTWTPNSTGTYYLTVTSQDPPGVETSYRELDFTVSNLTVTGEPGLLTQLYVNGTAYTVPSGKSTLLILGSNSEDFVSAPAYYYGNYSAYRQKFLAFKTATGSYATYNFSGAAASKVEVEIQTEYPVKVVDPVTGSNESWVQAGSMVNLTAPRVYLLNPNQTRLILSKWIVNGVEYNSTTEDVRADGQLTLIPFYVRQNLVTVSYNGQTTRIWVDQGSTFTATAPPTVGGVMGLQLFSGWSGTVTSKNNTLTFKVYSPVDITASYTPVYAGFDALAVALLIVGVFLGTKIRRRAQS